MSLNLDRPAWKRVALRELVRHVTDRVDPETSGLERFLAGEHIPSGELAISTWGVIGEDPIGPMFYKRFKPGHVLYVSRRTYLRKVAVPDFEGITGEKTFVLETLDPHVLLQGFLPFVLSAERFHAYAIANSRGSVNPYLNWGELLAYEFDLPPLEEQKRLADLLWTIEAELRATEDLASSLRAARGRLVDAFLKRPEYEVEPIDRVVEFLRDGPFGSKIKSEHYADAGVRVLRLQDVQRGYVSDEDIAYLDESHVVRELERYRVAEGDVVIAGLGDERHPVGRASLAGRVAGAVHKADVFRARVKQDRVLPEFFVNVLNAELARPRVAALSQGTTRLRINTSNLKKVALPWPPVADQGALLSAAGEFDDGIELISARMASAAAVRATLRNEIFGGGR
ncbi:restriction endonuclease subunit S [Actinopolymorpha sp. B11F2]|uniref:restriction endonuclease subunit S n=1 Tax=Actinopolymorpha sp. B11F2 TaxID=3160862 RepID=UPI0032E46141